MNLLSLLDHLSAVDAPSGAAPRRHLLRQLGQAGAWAAVAGLPLALAPAAEAAPTSTSLDAVLLLLKLEELLTDFYIQALAAPVLTAAGQAAVRPGIDRIRRQQQGHAQFLRTTLTTNGLTPPPAPRFDFSGRKNNPANPILFPDVLNDFSAFLQLAQQLEDASVAIYLGQASFLTTDKPLLDAVLRMQLVEARHAAHVRTLRRAAGTTVKSWPSTTDVTPNPAVLVPNPAGGSAAPVAIYTFEATETQLVSGTNTVPFTTILTGATAVQPSAVAEAFDEPLPTAQATALLGLFG